MRNVLPGDRLVRGTVKWIVRISNLNHGNPISLYNGLTPSHPVCQNGSWIKAKHYRHATFTYTTDLVYDIVLAEPEIGSMQVNGIEAAVLGFPVPGTVHPYFGSRGIVSDIETRYPNGGYVDVDARYFQFTNGLVSSIFG